MFLAVKEIQVIHCTCSKVIDDKHRQAVCSAVSGYFDVNIPSFFTTIVSLFGARAAPFLTAPASAPAAPAPHPWLKLFFSSKSEVTF